MLLTSQCFNHKVKKTIHVMAKPIGSKCNLDCQYCYYLSKEELLAERSGACEKMDEASLEAYIKQYFAAHNAPQVNFSQALWISSHGLGQSLGRTKRRPLPNGHSYPLKEFYSGQGHAHQQDDEQMELEDDWR